MIVLHHSTFLESLFPEHALKGRSRAKHGAFQQETVREIDANGALSYERIETMTPGRPVISSAR
jgi:hypothetical protein